MSIACHVPVTIHMDIFVGANCGSAGFGMYVMIAD
jgi:hypothetical protein